MKRRITIIVISIFIAVAVLFLYSGCSKSTSTSIPTDANNDNLKTNTKVFKEEKIPEQTSQLVEVKEYRDFLTPAYYLEGHDESIKEEIDKFIYYVRKEQFHSPLENPKGQTPGYTVRRKFGDGIGPGGTVTHHPAEDLYIGNNESIVNIYAAHDGVVSVFKDAPKYRQYLSITKEIIDDDGIVIGKLVTIYAHLDLDIDESESLFMGGQTVTKGDLISKNLYSETKGGPHLHFEIRYYSSLDVGEETFYGFSGPEDNSDLTEASAGGWLFGYWNPNIGYGFGNPKNHGLSF